ncbi:ABC transporter permease [Nitratireductor pacificus]|uniref:Peptide ABC transporter permease n=1 Tax=Nitratireductor pacificus pht-3B TaxID=391937 RepID=K2M4D9_9HYPH|nr:ABC transporter permease [Nitratireductor pacificus]EKF16921.1 peptide ABC transporter permease [Nitratireductor pacificus pht-3B]
MIAFILRRLFAVIPVLLLVTLASFLLMRLIPGDPAMLIADISASDAEIEKIREQLGLNEPFLTQLLHWYGNLLRGDLGESYLLGRSVTQAIWERLPTTLSLTLLSFVLSTTIAVTLGVIAAVKANTWLDQFVMSFALIGVALPNFWMGLMLIILFSVHLGWLPSGGYVPLSEDFWGWLRTCTLPAISLALLQIGLLSRITRATMLEVLQQDYIRTARAKGLSKSKVVGKHALKNVLVPVITILGISFSLLISGSLVIETVFSLPGVGKLLGSAILRRDYPVIQGGLIFVAVSMIFINLLVDILYAWVDPRVRY